MKIYITASIRLTDESMKDINNLVKHLESKGHNVNKYKLAGDYAKKQSFDEGDLSEYHKKMMNSIKQCDVVIADISTKSSGLGYEVAIALQERKPILALFRGRPQDHSSLSLSSNPSKLLKLRNYTPETINQVAEDFLKEAKEQIDTKFILIISPEIDKYLSWASDERRMHKAQLVRNAVEEMMAKDKDYKQFLKETGMA